MSRLPMVDAPFTPTGGESLFPLDVEGVCLGPLGQRGTENQASPRGIVPARVTKGEVN
jgi:hypothetical protein